jgi:hypothetical protein
MSNEPCTFEQHHAGRVFELATIGLSKKDIAAKIGVPLRDLCRLYRAELKKGTAEGHEDVLRTVHQIAITGNNASVLIFYLKAQCGWRDTGASASAAKIIPHYSWGLQTESNLGQLPSP